MAFVWKNRVIDLLSFRTIVNFLLPKKRVQSQGKPCRLPRILSSKSTSLVVQRRKVSTQMQQVHKSSSSVGFSDLDCLQS